MKKLKKQIELRRVELGVQKKKGEEDKLSILFKEGEVEKTAGFNDFQISKQLPNSQFGVSQASKFSRINGVGRKFMENFKGPEVVLFDYDAEEQRDVDAIKIVVRKYSKLFKFLFTKYANSGYSVKAFKNFEELNKKLQTISVAEIMKMLRDHFVTNRIISKSKISEIARQVHENSTPMPLEYKYFVEFFIQLGYVIYTSPPNNMTHLTPAETLIKLITFFEDAARSKGQSTLLYEDPDATSFGDKKILEELNRRIAVNPNYSLPEGYTKIVEKDFNYEYTLPSYYNITEAERVSVYILDSLCDKLFDFHFIEPMVKYEEIVKVRPTFKKQFQQSREPLQYMNKLERKNKLVPLENPLSSSRKLSNSTTDTSEPSVELSTALKIEVGLYPFGKRAQITKIAEVLEEILQAVEAGRDSLAPRSQVPAARVNKAVSLKIEEEGAEKQAQKVKEEKRRKREKEVKEQLRKAREEKEREEQENKKRIREQEKAEREKAKESEAKAKATKERKKKAFEEAKKAKEEESERVRKEMEEEERKRMQENKMKNKEFLKMQNKKINEKFENDKKEREDFKKKEEELKVKEIQKQKKMKEGMEEYLNKNKENRKLEFREKLEIDRFYSTEEIQALMTLYDAQLQQMYKYYTLQGDIQLDGNVGKRMTVIEFNNWVKLGYNTNITPHLISSDDMVAIYRLLEREMEADSDEKEEEIKYIDFDHFKKGLIRITILAKTQSIETEVKKRQRRISRK